MNMSTQAGTRNLASTPKIHLFVCSTCLDPDQIDRYRAVIPGTCTTVISLPCSGKMDIPYFMKAFETGADGVFVVTCQTNECRNLEGNLRARKRADAVDTLLDEIGLGRGRVRVVHVTNDNVDPTLDDLKRFVESLQNQPCTKLQKSVSSQTASHSAQPLKFNPQHRQEIA